MEPNKKHLYIRLKTAITSTNRPKPCLGNYQISSRSKRVWPPYLRNLWETKETYTPAPYRAKLTLDTLQGSAGAGLSNGLYGTQVGGVGGIEASFSDVLGDHTVGVFASINRNIKDARLGTQYINKKGRIQWGFGLSLAPPQWIGFGSSTSTPVTDMPGVESLTNEVILIFQDQASFIAALPINKSLRIEGNISTSYRYYHHHVDTLFIGNNTKVNNIPRTYRIIGQETTKRNHGDNDFAIPLNINSQQFNYQLRYGFLHSAGIVLVGDNSHFGLTSPLAGSRFRVGLNAYGGLYNFTSLTADYRKYIRFSPFTLAVRAYHHARYGKDSDAFTPIFLGWPGLVRGIGDAGSVQELAQRYGLQVPHLQVSKLALDQVERRLSLTGSKQIFVIPSKLLFSALSAFVDMDAAFDSYDQITFFGKTNRTTELALDQSVVIATAGISFRVNLFRVFILEPYYAIPLRENVKGEFGLNFLLPGF